MPIKIFPTSGMAANQGAIGGHVRYALNLAGVGGTYRPWQRQSLDTALFLTGAPANAMHVHLFPTSAGTASYTGDLSTTFAGTKTRLYEVRPTGGFDLSRAANYAQTAGDEPCAWSFCSFGNDPIASNYVDPIQYRAGNGGLFADLITSSFKPQARFIDVARTALIVANLEGSAGAGTGFADEYAWSVFGNAASFDPAGGAGRQRSLARPGQITGLVGGEYFRLFKSNSMSGVQFTGSSVAPWREDLISGSIGTPYGKSIVETREGEVAFWGGDGFYKQAGMSPPQRIGVQLGSELINHGTGAAFDTGLNLWFPMKLVTYPNGMLIEDRVIHGARCARTGIIMWVVEVETLSPSFPSDGKRITVLWDPATDLWSYGNLSQGAATIATYPDLSADYLYAGLVGMGWNGVESRWFRFSSTQTEQVLLRWGATPLAPMEGAEPAVVRVKGVMPLISWDIDQSRSSPPTELTVTVRAYDDPYLGLIVGGQPRTFTVRLGTNNSEWGWMNEPLEGRFIQIDLGIDPTLHRIPVIHGVAVDFEIVAEGAY